MDGDATATPCPDCDESVTALADYCPYCGAALDGTEAGSETAGASESGGQETNDGGATATGEESDGSPPIDRLIDPDSTLDAALGLALGCLVGVVVAVPTFLAVASFGSAVGGVLSAVVAAVAAGAIVAIQTTAGDGFRYGTYLVGGSLLLLPFVAFSPAAEGGEFAGRVLLFLAGEGLFGAVALLCAGVGYGATKGLDRLRGLR